MKLVRNVAVVVVVALLAIAFVWRGLMAQEKASSQPSDSSTPGASGSATEKASPAESATPSASSAVTGTTAREFTEAAEMVGKTKFWFPSTIVVQKGDHVRITLKNDIPGDPNQHGFSIPAFNVTELVTRGDTKKVEFTADKAGVFPFICHVHPPHVGGQLIVLEKSAVE